MSILTSSNQVVSRLTYLTNNSVLVILPPSHQPCNFTNNFTLLKNDLNLINHPNLLTSHLRAQPIQLALDHSKFNSNSTISINSKADAHLINQLIPLTNQLLNTPVTINLSIDIADDLSDVLSLRSSGIPIIFSSTPIEAHDHTLIAQKLSKESNTTVIHVFEDSQVENFVHLSQDDIVNFLNSPLNQSNGVNGHSNGVTNGINGVDHLPSNQSSKLLEKFDAIALQTLITTRRPQRTSFYKGPSSPKNLIVTFGTASPAFLSFTNKDSEHGVLALNWYRPLDYQRLLDLIPTSVERIAVLEQVTKKSNQFSPLFVDVISAFATSDRQLPVFSSGVIGSISQDKIPLIIESVLTNLNKDQPEHCQLYGKLSDSAQSNYEIYVPKHEKSYSQLLDQIFGERLTVANSPEKVPTEGIDVTSPEFAFGSTLANINKRESVINGITELISTNNAVSNELHEAFSNWLIKKDDPKSSELLAKAAIEILKNEKPSHPKVQYILDNSNLLASQSRWIIGSDAWSYDVGFSGLHHGEYTFLIREETSLNYHI